MKILTHEFRQYVSRVPQSLWLFAREGVMQYIRYGKRRVVVGLRRATQGMRHRPWRLLTVSFISIGIGVYMQRMIGLYVALALFFGVYAWESRIAGVITLLTLVSCSVLLVLGYGDMAETAAVHVLCLMALTLGLRALETWRASSEIAQKAND